MTAEFGPVCSQEVGILETNMCRSSTILCTDNFNLHYCHHGHLLVTHRHNPNLGTRQHFCNPKKVAAQQAYFGLN